MAPTVMGEMAEPQVADACVIGAGPVGIFAVFQLGILGIRCHVVDRGAEPGGQCCALYADKPIYDIPAWPLITGGELIDRLMQQIRPFDTPFHLGCTALRIEQRRASAAFPSGCWRVVTENGIALDCRLVVIASGGGKHLPTIEGTGPAIAKARVIPVDTEKFQTARAGVFAIGDAASYPGKLKLIVTGFHEAAMMAQEAFRICHAQATGRLSHSSSARGPRRKPGG